MRKAFLKWFDINFWRLRAQKVFAVAVLLAVVVVLVAALSYFPSVVRQSSWTTVAEDVPFLMGRSVVDADGRININFATAAELEVLPGIGGVRAESIVLYRQQNGAYTSVEDLLNVPGIGPKTVNGIEELICVEQ